MLPEGATRRKEMNGNEATKGQMLDIPAMLAITQQRHDAKQAPTKKTKHEVSVADLGFTEPTDLFDINQAAMCEGYESLPDAMLLTEARSRSKRLYCPKEVFVLFK